MERVFEKALAEICRSKLLDEKWLLSPTRRVGYQWIDSLAMAGCPVVNARVKTLRSMAFELAAREMAQSGNTFLSAVAGAALAGSLLHRDTGSYLSSLQPGLGLSEALYRTLQSLRFAGLTAGDLAEGAFEMPAKRRDIAGLLSVYTEELSARRLWDYGDMLRAATERVRHEPPDAIVLITDSMVTAALEQELLDALGDALISLPVDQPSTPGPHTACGLLRFVSTAPNVPEPVKDGTTAIFHAAGESNEVREALRRCISLESPLDRVELLYTDAETYVPILYDTCTRLELPITFADGIPARYSRPGRALMAWAQWVRDGFPQKSLVRMVREGLFQALNGPGFTRMAGALRTVPIGFDRNRYDAVLARSVAALERRVQRHAEFVDEDGEARARDLAAELVALKAARDLANRILALTPEPGVPQVAVLDAADSLLTGVARTPTELDGFARDRLVQEIRRMKDAVEEFGGTGLDAMEWLATLPLRLSFRGEGPRPGALYAAPIDTGGHTGRPHTFILGLDDARFPGGGQQDPLLLDGERSALSDRLPTAAGQLGEKLHAFYGLLARLRGEVMLSFSSSSLADEREMFPSPVVLAAYRVLSGNRQGELADLMESLGPPASVAPSHHSSALDETEWWLSRLCGEATVEAPLELVSARFPNLGRGMKAAEERSSIRFTEFDGNLLEPEPKLDPRRPAGPVLSASRAEALGTCPLRYFYRDVLGVRPPDELECEPNRWLDAAPTGTLLHEVFYRFLLEVVRTGRAPTLEDQPLLTSILEGQIEWWLEQVPSPSERALRSRISELRRACAVFIVEEVRNSVHSKPRYLEAAFGMSPSGPGTDIDCEDPVEVALPSGGRIRVRGRIDRVDQVPGGFALVDYKSGSDYKYRENGPFDKGRVLQHALYVAAAKERLGETPIGFSYFFPARRMRGKRLTWSGQALESGLGIVDSLCRLAASGAFPATDAPKDCKYCDYNQVCSTVAPAQSKAKLAGGDLSLEPFRELRGDGT